MIGKDIKLFISDTKTLLVLLVLALLGIAGVFLASGITPPTVITVGIVDHEQSNYSEMLKTYFAENEDFNAFVNIYEGTEEEVNARFEKGELDFYFIIPENFTSEMIGMKNTPIKAVINSDDKAKAAVYGALL
ncbi:MAG: ABC transporter permease, partial [Lachnospiraceae bacterium]|nr:ABC transporter permease [Lachnospiraceae bacterium]